MYRQIGRYIDNDVLSYDAYKVYEIDMDTLQGNGLLVKYSRHMCAIVTKMMSVIMLQYLQYSTVPRGVMMSVREDSSKVWKTEQK